MVLQASYFLFSQSKHVVGTQKNRLKSQYDSSFEYPKHKFKLMGKKIITILCTNKKCHSHVTNAPKGIGQA